MMWTETNGKMMYENALVNIKLLFVCAVMKQRFKKNAI